MPGAEVTASAPADRRAGAPISEGTDGPGGPFGRRAPLIAGMLVSLAVVAAGGGGLWWRNRDSRYWPA